MTLSALAPGPTLGTAQADTLMPAGQPMPIGDVAGWHQIFAEDFASPAPTGTFSGCITGLGLVNNFCSGLGNTPYFNRWFAYPDGWTGTPATGTYAPSASISVANGTLDYYLHSSSADGADIHMIDAAVPKLTTAAVGTGGLLYGRYLVRARWDALSSYHISFLLWPDSERWPQDGEIDYPEANMASPEVSAFMHRMNGTSVSDQDEYDVTTDPGQWHTYEIVWLPSSLSFYLDGQLIGRSTVAVPSTAMHWVLQTNTSPTAEPGDTQAGDLQVDWAVVYVPNPELNAGG